MIRSMTGFAALSRETAGQKVSLSVKSVNHRFLDVVVKAPQMLSPVEARIKAIAQQLVTRGRVDASLVVEFTVMPPRDVVLDEALLERIAAALDSARER